MLSRGVLAALRFVLLGHLSRGLVRTTDMIRQAGQTRQILRCVLLERSARGSRRTDWLLGAPSGLLRDPNSVDGRRGARGRPCWTRQTRTRRRADAGLTCAVVDAERPHRPPRGHNCSTSCRSQARISRQKGRTPAC
ncbi:hypothetical protein DMC30DRAFT_400636 [Rhodotorula diobovata]|uniref:Secreted protein n=1 Tax=Rhodotorula diobovata TaxID=5288 RepID=A0A5C5FUD7_9BASI|nr:hypothetical protein DMC30DRAFT_400636 [Rhodotorula diobovata]